jgi:molybdopterin biosynthesis enzyme
MRTVIPCSKMIRKRLRDAVAKAVKGDYDMVCIIGGSSAGSEDYAKPVITSLGQVLVHGVTMMPGKPVLMGNVHEKPVFGIPGYPVSAIVAFEQFAGPLLRRMQKLPPWNTGSNRCLWPGKSLPNWARMSFYG